MKIAVVGMGYVGLSLSTLLSQKYEVVGVDIDQNKINMINNNIVPIKDKYIEKYFKEKKLNLRGSMYYEEAFQNAKYVIICTPTFFDKDKNISDVSAVETVIKQAIQVNKCCIIIIKSTVPIGFTESMKLKYKNNNIIFSPEFSREGKSLYDHLYPSRIIVGEKTEEAEEFALLLKEFTLKKDVPILLMNSLEAESVKLFSNAYLALRVAFFNELDTFTELIDLNTKNVIKGVCLDSRIGDYYNNPSFGYGGYCLPKDINLLLSHYENIPGNLIESIINSNRIRKNHLVNMILNKNIKCLGIYRLIMKSESDNFRNSAIVDIIKILKKNNIKIIIYEPEIQERYFMECAVEINLNLFIKESDLIVTNRLDKNLNSVLDKVYTRDVFNNN